MPDEDQKTGAPASGAPPPEGAEPPAGDDPTSETPEDRFRPEAIAARVEQMGEETDVERVAREEERKLIERRRQGGKGKRALDAAASKRLSKIGETKVKRPSAASSAYVPEADPLIDRVRRVQKWIAGHPSVFAGLVAAGLLVVGGGVGWAYWQERREADASALLARAFADEHGHISATDDDDEDDSAHAHQLYPTFKSAGDRRAAALATYDQVQAKYARTGAAILARLAEAGLLLDQRDAKGALAAYEDVKGSALAQADGEVRGRALEGIGFADELLAKSDAASKDKHLDDALAAFKELEQVDVKGLKELGAYHQARVLEEKGDKAKAVEVLKDLYKRVSEPGETHPFSYLEFVVEDRLRELDPTALPPKAPRAAPGGPGPKFDTNSPEVQELLRKLQQQGAQRGGPVPMPRPESPRP